MEVRNKIVNKNSLEELISKDYSAARSARILLEARNNLFDAKQYAFSNDDDLEAIEENQAVNAMWVLAEKLNLRPNAVLQAVDDLWDGNRNLEETIEWLYKSS